MTPRIVDARVEHVAPIAARVRHDDSNELWGLSCISPTYAMIYGIRYSAFARTGFVGEDAVCMFGVVGSEGLGRPWMVGTDLLDRYQKIFLRRCRAQIDEMLNFFPRLENYVDQRNTRAISWLKWLGFEFGTAQDLGPHSLPFIPFYKER